MNMYPAVSTNVLAVGYDPQTRTLRVRFRSGGTYDYYSVSPAIFEQMLAPNPWRRVGRLVKAHNYAKIAWPAEAGAGATARW
jgi:KTSC domain